MTETTALVARLRELPRRLLWRMAEQFQSWDVKSDPDEEYVRWADVEAVLKSDALQHAGETRPTCATCLWFNAPKPYKRFTGERAGMCRNPDVLTFIPFVGGCGECDPYGMNDREFEPKPSFGCTLHAPAPPSGS